MSYNWNYSPIYTLTNIVSLSSLQTNFALTVAPKKKMKIALLLITIILIFYLSLWMLTFWIVVAGSGLRICWCWIWNWICCCSALSFWLNFANCSSCLFDVSPMRLIPASISSIIASSSAVLHPKFSRLWSWSKLMSSFRHKSLNKSTDDTEMQIWCLKYEKYKNELSSTERKDLELRKKRVQ